MSGRKGKSYIPVSGMFAGMTVKGTPKKNEPYVATDGLFKGMTVSASIPKPRFMPDVGSLVSAKKALKPVQEVSVPHSDGLSISRAKHHSGADFATFVERTRRDLTTINSTDTGAKMLSDMATAVRADKSKKVTITDAFNPSAPDSINENVIPKSYTDASRPSAFDFMGVGKGTGSTIKHHTERTMLDPTGSISSRHASETYSSAIALGHELGHAWAAQKGIMPHSVRSGKNLLEEHRNVGPSGQRLPGGQPTENSLRRDLNTKFSSMTIPQRTHYSGKKI